MKEPQVNWEDFTEEQKETMDMLQGIVSKQMSKQSRKPNWRHIKAVLLPQFEDVVGVGELTEEMRDAIAVSCVRDWEEVNPEAAKKIKDAEEAREKENANALNDLMGRLMGDGSIIWGNKDAVDKAVQAAEKAAADGSEAQAAEPVNLADFAVADLVKIRTHWAGTQGVTEYSGIIIAREENGDGNVSGLYVTYDQPDPAQNMIAWIDNVTRDEVVSIDKIDPVMPVEGYILEEIDEAAELLKEYSETGSDVPPERLVELINLIHMRAGGMGDF